MASRIQPAKTGQSHIIFHHSKGAAAAPCGADSAFVLSLVFVLLVVCICLSGNHANPIGPVY